MQEEKWLQTAVKAAKKAGNFVLENFTKEKNIEEKEDKTLVTQIDRQSEELIKKILREETPSFGIYAEETDKERKEYTWIIDPIDGTHNYYYGVPIFGLQIALEHKGEILVGVINLPVEGLLLTAVKGKGSYCNGKKLQVTKRGIKEASLLVETYFKEEDRKYISKFFGKVRHVTALNSAVTSLSYLALGRCDAVFDYADKTWDVSAGMLVVQEAGGKVTDINGEKVDIYNPTCMATNGVDHDKYLEIANS